MFTSHARELSEGELGLSERSRKAAFVGFLAKPSTSTSWSRWLLAPLKIHRQSWTCDRQRKARTQQSSPASPSTLAEAASAVELGEGGLDAVLAECGLPSASPGLASRVRGGAAASNQRLPRWSADCGSPQSESCFRSPGVATAGEGRAYIGRSADFVKFRTWH
jgi:hypothetical protein